MKLPKFYFVQIDIYNQQPSFDPLVKKIFISGY
jgi:hypothetical protein